MAEAYPGTFKIGNKAIFIKLWHRCLEDIDYTTAEVAMMDIYMNSESDFPPRPKDVRDKVLEFRKPELMQITGADAWGEVKNAIGRYGSMQYESTKDRYNEMMSTLSPMSQKIVKYIGWRELCTSTEPAGVIRGQFNRMFEQLVGREKTEVRRPPALTNQINVLIKAWDEKIKDKKIEGPNENKVQLLH